MFLWLTAALSLAFCLILLFLDGRRRERKVWRDWELLLSPRGERAYQAMEKRVHAELALADFALGRAAEARRLGSTEQAMQLLDTGCAIIKWFAPGMGKALAGMAVFSRMVSAMAPVTPLRPADFQLAQLSSLAYLNRLIHQFLVSTNERFRLRVYILRRAFDLAMHFLLQAQGRIQEKDPQGEAAWQMVATLRHDFGTLTEESLESFRVLLTSLAAERKDGAILAAPEDWGV
jgi:hypothetical protein